MNRQWARRRKGWKQDIPQGYAQSPRNGADNEERQQEKLFVELEMNLCKSWKNEEKGEGLQLAELIPWSE